MMIRDVSSKERLITKERRPLTVPRKICSGTGLISRVGSDGNLGSIMVDNARLLAEGDHRSCVSESALAAEGGAGGRGRGGHSSLYDPDPILPHTFLGDMDGRVFHYVRESNLTIFGKLAGDRDHYLDRFHWHAAEANYVQSS